MNDTKTITRLSQDIEDLTEMLNRVRSVIRAAGVDRSKALDPRGLLQMSREEYAEHLAEMQKISDEFDTRQKEIAGMNPAQIEKMIDELESAQLSSALSGLAS
jgi:uncharacterized coiled-coil DUF342 family protein|tara:strand:+ start:545 stop:853 length:309 start_codon:yes stop_codon:yes gene_type:complete